eukprot:TRINITY_DN3799_c0_g1_i1.p1 TRINITY_DN3799_c0_g1~~TRINITY_DN3799_c0_g1_i1.p1  ORF type:complete len:163 (-),score=17.40 TRINITY_DN3799_c0_g1_i1:657-1145(-)
MLRCKLPCLSGKKVNNKSSYLSYRNKRDFKRFLHYHGFKFEKKVKLSHNSFLFYFDPNMDSVPLGSHVTVRVKKDDYIFRSFSPISSPGDKFLELMVKIYDNGEMTQYLNNIKTGEYVDISEPTDNLKFDVRKYDEIGLIAGGTGIAPFMQVFNHTPPLTSS